MDVSAFILSLAQNHPVILTVVAAIGTARAVMKPVMSCIHTVLETVGATKLDGEVTAVEQSTVVKYILYVVDWISSIKIATPSVLVAAPQTAVVPVAAAAAAIAAAPVVATPAPAAAPTSTAA